MAPQPKFTDAVMIAHSLKPKPAFVQIYLILHVVSEEQNLKVYQIGRRLELDYYQTQRRVSDLANKGMIKVRNGSCSTTEQGQLLMELLEELILLFYKMKAKQ